MSIAAFNGIVLSASSLFDKEIDSWGEKASTIASTHNQASKLCHGNVGRRIYESWHNHIQHARTGHPGKAKMSVHTQYVYIFRKIPLSRSSFSSCPWFEPANPVRHSKRSDLQSSMGWKLKFKNKETKYTPLAFMHKMTRCIMYHEGNTLCFLVPSAGKLLEASQMQLK